MFGISQGTAKASFAGEQALEGFDAERLEAGVALDGEMLQPSGQLGLDVDQDPAFALAAGAAPGRCSLLTAHGLMSCGIP